MGDELKKGSDPLCVKVLKRGLTPLFLLILIMSTIRLPNGSLVTMDCLVKPLYHKSKQEYYDKGAVK
ncbi:hypothetical protein AAV98_04030 [Bacillus sp. CHD6a]|nr:hypothetical protein AAV98_04030 [Bacillus sp. CHD6a]